MSDLARASDERRVGNVLRKLWRQYVQKLWLKLEWPIVVLSLIVILALGYVGIKAYNSSLGQVTSLPDTIYSLLSLFVLGSNYVSGSLNFELEVVRFIAPLFPFYMILKLMTPLFHERLQLFYLRWFIRDHAIICGINAKSLAIARDFYERGYGLVVIDRNPGKDVIEKFRNMDAIVLAGDPADPAMLKKAQVEKARYTVSVLDDEDANAEVAVNAGGLIGDRRNKALTCYVHIADRQLWGLLRGYQLNMGRIDSFRVEFVNVYDSGARVLLDKYRKDMAGMAIIGPGRIGESLIVEAARDRYFGLDSGKLRIALVDGNAKERKDSLMRQYPAMSRSCDIVPFNVDVRSLHNGQPGPLAETFSGSRIFVCAGDDAGGISIALSMLPYINDDRGSLVLCTEQHTGLADILKSAGGDRLQVFSLLDPAYGQEVLLGGINSILAKAIHETYIREQIGQNIPPSSNPSMAPWDELPEDLKESNRRSADHIMAKLRAVGCDIMPSGDWGEKALEFTKEEVEKMSVMEHDRWVGERVLQGYRFSAKKDTENKTSPYIISWDKLPENIREYDRQIVRELPIFLAREGFRVYRPNSGPRVILPEMIAR